MNNFLLEHVSCDFCGCENYKTRYRKPDNWLMLSQYEFSVVECTKCKLVYLNPRPTQESMGEFYPKDYHEDRNTDSYKIRYKRQLEYLPGLNNETILDIGCARGDFLAYIKNEKPNVEVVGVDYFSEKVDYEFIEFYKNSLQDTLLESERFDVITAWAVFEHLHEPGLYFKEVNRLLKKGGRFMFLVTNSESLYGTHAYVEDVPRHTYHFSELTLNQYAKKFKFNHTKYFYETRFWDATGAGTFYYKLMEVFGSTWEKRYHNNVSWIQRKAGKLGKFIDKFVFSSNWEARLKKSGILVCEFIK
jgi:2-polyprenyl-3-methyl-5-hydroxy-6-metoxy-1,4-benzoquinol methylase